MEQIEELIARAEIALCYADRDEVLARFVADGIEPEIAYLAISAAGVA